jgi:hypothetical protein
MSTVPSGTRFIGISENVNLTERKSATLNAETQPYTMQDIADTVGAGAQGLQEVTDNGGNTTTNSITLTSDTVPVNIGYGVNGNLDVLTFTDNGVDVSLGFAGLVFNGGTFASGLSPTSVEFNQNNKKTYYRVANILFRDLVTYKDLNINYPTSIVGTNKEQTFQDASGTIALTSQLPTVAGDYLNDPAAAAGGVLVGGMYHTAGVVKIRLT